MAIQRGMRVAISMAIGAAAVEFLQSYIALSFYHILTHNEEMERSIIVICIPIFLIVGIYYLLKKHHHLPRPTTKAAHLMGAARGIVLSSVNLMAIPYFVVIGGYLASANYISLKAEFIAAFSSGVVLGSFITFFYLCAPGPGDQKEK